MSYLTTCSTTHWKSYQPTFRYSNYTAIDSTLNTAFIDPHHAAILSPNLSTIGFPHCYTNSTTIFATSIDPFITTKCTTIIQSFYTTKLFPYSTTNQSAFTATNFKPN
jgi:hypothetical protein